LRASLPASRASGGFTLIEVIAAMGMLMLLVGGLYAIAAAAIDLSRSSQTIRLQEIKLTLFTALMRDGFDSAPRKAEFDLQPLPHGESGALTLRNAHGLFSWNGAISGDTVAFVTEPDPDFKPTGGLEKQKPLRLVVKHWNAGSQTAGLPLLSGIRSVRWRLFDPEARQWFEVWRGGDKRPLFVELQFELIGDPGPRREVFWISNFEPPAIEGGAAPNTELPRKTQQGGAP
jgi:hypothetical protein